MEISKDPVGYIDWETLIRHTINWFKVIRFPKDEKLISRSFAKLVKL